MRPLSHAPLSLLLLGVLLPGCSGGASAPSAVEDALQRASEVSGVPRDVLAVTSYSLTRWRQRGGVINEEGAVGIMNLHVEGAGPSMAEAVALTGKTEEQLTVNLADNMLGGAMILAQRARELEQRTGNPVDTLEEWYSIVAWYSGAPDPMVSTDFAAETFDFLQFGLADEAEDGHLLTVEARDMTWRPDGQTARTDGSVDQFVPACSSNYSDYSRGGGDIDMVVIHTTQGSYSGAVSWMQNCSSEVSAHYVVRSSDGAITQMVQHEDVAWHAGHWDTNVRSIGIEHEGYVEDPSAWYTDNMYRASAALVSALCDQYGIPKDRSHIIGHYEVPGCSGGSGGGSACHTDPGSGWDWDYYMSLVTGSGSGSSSMGGSGLPDGGRTGSFSAKVTATRYGETDTCSGPVSGAVNGGRLYLSGTCTLVNHPDKSGNLPVTWSGAANGDKLEGQMAVDGRTAAFTGDINADGSITAHFSGSEDLGGDVGVLEYDVTLSAGM